MAVPRLINANSLASDGNGKRSQNSNPTHPNSLPSSSTMKYHTLIFTLLLYNGAATALKHNVGIRGRKTTEGCGICSSDVCEKQACSSPNFYVCTQAGTISDATGGCNPGAGYWRENDRNCKDCCDIRSCPVATQPTAPGETPPVPSTKTSKSKSKYGHRN